ncbi:lck-interacting transmembrane adapter 1 [Pelodytes ibericus]
MASDHVQNVSSETSLPALLTSLGLFLLVCGLCTLCKKRKKRRMQNICHSRGPVVDVSLLRQTQLRSLSKSDTKLHEIQRPHLGDAHLRPVSMDPGYQYNMWQQPPQPQPCDATYSNLSFTPKAQHSSLYQGVGSRSELACSGQHAPVNAVTDEYACVRKVKRGGDLSAQEKISLPPGYDPCTVRPDGLRIEDMYSKVCKKNNTCAAGNSRVTTSMFTKHFSPQKGYGTPPEENLYESICEMSSHAPEVAGIEDDITEF